MKKLIFAFCLITQTSYTQGIFPYNKVYKFDWSTIEVPSTIEEKRRFLNSLPDNSFYKTDKPNVDEFVNGLHSTDINGDKKMDFIYNGIYPGEGTLVEIFLKRADKYESIFSELGEIGMLETEDGNFKVIHLVQLGCCADPTTTFSTYFIDEAEIKFHKTFETRIITGTPLPEQLFTKPITFETLNERYYLRSDPSIKDQPFDEYLEQFGNQIGQLTKGTKGRAIGEKTDETGRVWWFVEIDPEYKILKTVFYQDNYPDRQNLGKITGWISSRYVKRLKE